MTHYWNIKTKGIKFRKHIEIIQNLIQKNHKLKCLTHSLARRSTSWGLARGSSKERKWSSEYVEISSPLPEASSIFLFFTSSICLLFSSLSLSLCRGNRAVRAVRSVLFYPLGHVGLLLPKFCSMYVMGSLIWAEPAQSKPTLKSSLDFALFLEFQHLKSSSILCSYCMSQRTKLCFNIIGKGDSNLV